MAVDSRHNRQTSRLRRRALRLRNVKILKTLFVVVFIFGAFVAGFLLRGNNFLLDRLGFSSLVPSFEQDLGDPVAASTYNSLSARVAEVEGILNTESLADYELDGSTTALLEAFSSSTQDGYLRYYSPTRYAGYVQENPRRDVGVGVLFSEYEGVAYVADVFERSVAEAAGVQVGDVVVAIDGDRSQNWTSTEAINAVSREEGATVVITWRRPASTGAAGGEEFTTTLECSSATTQNVTSEVRDAVGYVAVKQFTRNSANLVERTIASLERDGVSAFVLDLRDNPGGYLTQAVEIASLFMRNGVVVEIQTKQGTTQKSASGQTATEKPLVVLVNERTSSAAEVLVAALQESQQATVIGTMTLGKGSVQVVKPLSFGGALRYTVAHYKTPSGRDIQGVGVVPDIEVGQGEDPAIDAQKDFAFENARSLISQS